jgi:hypothetical protein
MLDETHKSQSLHPEVTRAFEIIDIVAAVLCMCQYRITAVTKLVETLDIYA